MRCDRSGRLSPASPQCMRDARHHRPRSGSHLKPPERLCAAWFQAIGDDNEQALWRKSRAYAGYAGGLPFADSVDALDGSWMHPPGCPCGR